MRRKKISPIKLFIFGIVFTFIGGAIILLKAYPEYRLAKETLLWPQAEGVILRSEVTQKRVRVKSGKHGRKKTKIQYKPEIRYSFNVDGKKYYSSQIYVGSNTISTDSTRAHKVKNEYPVGKNVKVYYSLKLKEESLNAVLEPGTNIYHYLFLGMGFLALLVGIMSLGSSISKMVMIVTMVSVFFSSLFGKKQKKNDRSSRPRRTKSRKNILETKSKIDLDDEMSHFNKVSSSSFEPDENPRNHKWFIKGRDKDYGPYSFEKLFDYYTRGKVKDNHKCYSSSDGKVIKISNIIEKKKAA